MKLNDRWIMILASPLYFPAVGIKMLEIWLRGGDVKKAWQDWKDICKDAWNSGNNS